jgi:hypothetical protein
MILIKKKPSGRKNKKNTLTQVKVFAVEER